MKFSKRAAGTTSRTISVVLAALWIALLAAACQPGVTPSPRPTARVMTVQVTPALTVFSEQFRQCADELPGTGLVVLERPASALEDAAVALRWGAGNNLKGYAAVIGQEELVIIAHPQNPLASIPLADLQATYQGSLREWPKPVPSAEIQAWTYPAGDDTQALFESAVMNDLPVAENTVSLAPNPAAVREAVAMNPAAIGFLPKRWVDSSVKILAIDNLDPARLRQPLLAASKSEPMDPEKPWLLCLQEQIR